MREQLIREVEIIPLEVVVRNVAAAALASASAAREGTQLPARSSSSTTRDDKLHDPMVAEEHILRLQLGEPRTSTTSWRSPSRINDFPDRAVPGRGHRSSTSRSSSAACGRGDMARIVLADEISPDSCRLWDIGPARRWTRTASGATSATSPRPIRKSPGVWASFPNRAATTAKAPFSSNESAFTVTLKKGVLDPQGKAIAGRCTASASTRSQDARQGKFIELDLAGEGRRRRPRPGGGDVQKAPRQHGDRELRRRDRLNGVWPSATSDPYEVGLAELHATRAAAGRRRWSHGNACWAARTRSGSLPRGTAASPFAELEDHVPP